MQIQYQNIINLQPYTALNCIYKKLHVKQNQFLSLQGQKSSTKQCMFSIKLPEDDIRTCRSDHACLPITPNLHNTTGIPYPRTSSSLSPDCADYLFTNGASLHVRNRPCSKNTTIKQNSAANISPLQTYPYSSLASCKTRPFIYIDEHSNVPCAEPHRAGEAVAAAKETDRTWRPRGGVGGGKTLGVIFLQAFVARTLPFRKSMRLARAP